MVNITIRGSNCRLKNIPDSVMQVVRDRCSFRVKNAEKSELYREGKWDGIRRFVQTDGLFPLGLLERVTNILIEHGIPYEVTRHKEYKEMPINDPIDFTATLRDYQQDAIDAIINHPYGQGVIQVATGGGKTVIASGLIAQIKQKTLFVVHTKDLMYQAMREIQSFTGLKVGQMGDGVLEIGDVTIATMQTLSLFVGIKYVKATDESDQKEKKLDGGKIASNKPKVMEMLRSTRLLIWDEVHRIACDMAISIAKKVDRTAYRVGLSASPWRDDGADMDIESAIGSVIYKMSASMLIDLGYLVTPIIKIDGVTSLAKSVNKLPYDSVYRIDIVENRARNQRIVDYYKEFTSQGRQTLILVKNIKHGNIIKKMICEQYDPIDFLSGRDASTKRNNTIEELRTGDRIGLIASVIADEGLDIKRLGAVILAGGGKSTTRALQRIGRAIRPFDGKDYAFVVDFKDEHPYLLNHSAMRKSIYLTEPKFIIIESGVMV